MTTSLADSRFSRLFAVHSHLPAPMALASGGAHRGLRRAGALGLVGGGYGDLAWTQREPAAAERGPRERIGCGFILEAGRGSLGAGLGAGASRAP